MDVLQTLGPAVGSSRKETTWSRNRMGGRITLGRTSGVVRLWSDKDGETGLIRNPWEIEAPGWTPLRSMFFVFNRDWISQAECRGFDPRLPLHVFNSLGS